MKRVTFISTKIVTAILFIGSIAYTIAEIAKTNTSPVGVAVGIALFYSSFVLLLMRPD